MDCNWTLWKLCSRPLLEAWWRMGVWWDERVVDSQLVQTNWGGESVQRGVSGKVEAIRGDSGCTGLTRRHRRWEAASFSLLWFELSHQIRTKKQNLCSCQQFMSVCVSVNLKFLGGQPTTIMIRILKYMSLLERTCNIDGIVLNMVPLFTSLRKHVDVSQKKDRKNVISQVSVSTLWFLVVWTLLAPTRKSRMTIMTFKHLSQPILQLVDFKGFITQTGWIERWSWSWKELSVRWFRQRSQSGWMMSRVDYLPQWVMRQAAIYCRKTRVLVPAHLDEGTSG